jgi:hypothetical protein
VVAGVAACALLSACGGGDGTVRVDSPSGGDAGGCTALIRALPAQVNDESRRTTSGYSAAAAWGDPAIVLRCGVPTPREYTRTAHCDTVNGVDWFFPAEQVGDDGADVVFTLLHRSPRVEVRVPAHYRPQGPGNVLVDLAKVVKAHTIAHGHCA